MSDITDQLLALAKHSGAPDVVEDAAHMLKALEGVRAERDILQEIVDEQRGQIAKLVSRVTELTTEADAARREADSLRPLAQAQWGSYSTAARLLLERDEARRDVCELRCNPPPDRFIGLPHELAKVNGWDCFPEATP